MRNRLREFLIASSQQVVRNRRSMKKISCIIVTVILLLCVTAGCSKPEGTRKLSDIVSEKVQDIAVVNIISGNTGEIKSYKEADDIDKITAYMQNVMCTKSSPASASGWSYAFEITGTDGTSVKVIFAGTNSSIDKEKYALQYSDLNEFIAGL
jgi:hypothetical protein